MSHIQDFTIKEKSRLQEFIAFKSKYLRKTQFRRQPIYIPIEGVYKISIVTNLIDLSALETLFQEWDAEDEGHSVDIGNTTFLERLFGRLIA